MPFKSDATLRDLPRGVWVLGFVSPLMDVGSEAIHGRLEPLALAGAGGRRLGTAAEAIRPDGPLR
jgi:hypothetical protein